jgi:voltage-dependent potassium channel beta subunit
MMEEMQYRRLGRAGVKVSVLSLGAWITYGGQVGERETRACMRAAYEAGVNFFDNAEAYAAGQAEILMGRVLKKEGWPRDTYLVSSKVFWGGERPNQVGLSRKHVIEACHAALRRLQTDYLDLYFCHRPDPESPLDETARAMHDLIAQGKVLYWGTSEWSAADIQQVHGVCERERLHRPQMEQPQYNMFHRERVEVEYRPLYETIGLGTTVWSPLMSGLLTGKYDRGIPPGTRVSLPGYEWLRKMFERDIASDRIDRVREVGLIARELDCTPAQLALAWCVKNPHVSTVITGASRVEQVRENMRAAGVVERLTSPVMLRIEQILKNQPAG